MDKQTNQPLTQAGAIQFVQKYVARARMRGIKIDQVYLFGSYARGTPQKDSDVDICVISNDFGKDYFLDEVKLLKIVHEFSTPADVIPFHPHDLANKFDPLAKEVRKFGIIIT